MLLKKRPSTLSQSSQGSTKRARLDFDLKTVFDSVPQDLCFKCVSIHIRRQCNSHHQHCSCWECRKHLTRLQKECSRHTKQLLWVISCEHSCFKIEAPSVAYYGTIKLTGEPSFVSFVLDVIRKRLNRELTLDGEEVTSATRLKIVLDHTLEQYSGVFVLVNNLQPLVLNRKEQCETFHVLASCPEESLLLFVHAITHPFCKEQAV